MELVPPAGDPRPQFLSLGAGVQSSALLLMLDTGALPGRLPDAALFADTGWEPAAVYRYLSYLERTVRRIPIHRVSAGNMRQQLLDHAAGRSRFASPPLYVRHPGGRARGQLRRQCTREFKIEPMLAWLREHGYGRQRPIVQLLGITLDEIERVSPSRVKWASVAWPLVHHRLTRASCFGVAGRPRAPAAAEVGMCRLPVSQSFRLEHAHSRRA